jgi:rare lipoprotein A
VAAFLLPVVCHAGEASYYGKGFHGRKMANGQIYDQNSNSCAHKTLPFGTQLKVTFRGNSTVCVVRDRGPFVRGRDIDLSVAGAKQIGLVGPGHGPVTIEKL